MDLIKTNRRIMTYLNKCSMSTTSEPKKHVFCKLQGSPKLLLKGCVNLHGRDIILVMIKESVWWKDLVFFNNYLLGTHLEQTLHNVVQFWARNSRHVLTNTHAYFNVYEAGYHINVWRHPKDVTSLINYLCRYNNSLFHNNNRYHM